MKKIVSNETKRINRKRVFRYIYDRGTVSRQDITIGLDLSLPTVNQNIKELFDLGYVDYSGNFQSTGGRKAQAILVPSDIRYAISINIRAKYVRASLINLYGESCSSREYNEKFSTDENYAKLMARIVKDMIRDAGGEKDKILGVGITVPGTVDRNKKLLVSAPTLNIKNFDLNNLTKYIDLNCSVENDARSFAYTQMWKDKRSEKALFLLVDWGVGGLIMTGNDTFTGLQNREGEFGHMIIHPKGKKCACGRIGCMEAYVSTAVLSEDLGININNFFKNVGNNDKYRKILDQYLDDLALGINNISTMYGAPVVIGGEITKYLADYMDILKEKIRNYNAGFISEVQVSLSPYRKEESMIGAALMYIGEFLETV